MRRISLLLTAALCAFPAFAQESESVDKNSQLTVIPRIEANPLIPVKGDTQGGFSFSNSSLYTLLEGAFGERWSYSISNHWVSSDLASLYKNTLHSDELTWCDWANLSVALGNFDVTVGKQCFVIGTFEEDAYDYDSHYDLCSQFWNNMPIYQWGAGVTYNFGDSYSICAQMTTSPFGERPFASGLYAYSLSARGETDAINFLAAGNAFALSGNEYILGVNGGVQVPVGKFTLGLDAMYNTFNFNHQTALIGTVNYAPSEKFELIGKLGWESRKYSGAGENEMDLFGDGNDWEQLDGICASGIDLDKSYLFGGFAAQYYPLRDSRDLRLHCVAAMNNYVGAVTLNLGLTYFFNILF